MASPKRKHVLARLRAYLHVTQGQLAEWCGCSPVTVQSIEVGRLALSPKLAERVSLVTGAPTAWLLENKPDSPIPSLDRKKAKEPGEIVSPRRSKATILRAAIRALRALDSIKDTQSLTLLDYYTERYYGELQKAFGERKETGEPEDLMDYVKAHLDAFVNPSEEERKRDEEMKAHVIKDSSQSDVPKPTEKKPRQPRRATRRTRESA